MTWKVSDIKKVNESIFFFFYHNLSSHLLIPNIKPITHNYYYKWKVVWNKWYLQVFLTSDIAEGSVSINDMVVRTEWRKKNISI